MTTQTSKAQTETSKSECMNQIYAIAKAAYAAATSDAERANVMAVAQQAVKTITETK